MQIESVVGMGTKISMKKTISEEKIEQEETRENILA